MSMPTVPYYPITHDDGLDIINALNNLTEAESSPSLIAEDFDETKSYVIGDYVIYSTLLYRFIAPHSAGAWNDNHVTQVKVGEELSSLNIGKADNSTIAPEFRNDTNYAIGDVVSYEGGLYRYLLAHTAGDWDRTEVVATNAISEGGGGGSGTGVGDEITFDGDNMIITSSERSIESLESSIAIVANGNTHPLINQGEYVYVKNHNILSEGLYIANSTIVETDDLTTSNLSNISKGGFNKTTDIAHGGTGATSITGMVSNFFKVTTTIVQATITANAATGFDGPTISQSGYKPLIFSIYPGSYCDRVMWQCGNTTISGDSVKVGTFYLCSTYNSTVTVYFHVMVLWYKA